jgi:hypothetical protein
MYGRVNPLPKALRAFPTWTRRSAPCIVFSLVIAMSHTALLNASSQALSSYRTKDYTIKVFTEQVLIPQGLSMMRYWAT